MSETGPAMDIGMLVGAGLYLLAAWILGFLIGYSRGMKRRKP